MKTLYNINLKVEDCPKFIDEKRYNETLKLFDKEGIIGKKRVDLMGRIFNGYDLRCVEKYNATFYFGVRDIKMTIPEMTKEMQILQPNNPLTDLATVVTETLAEHDPSSQILDYNIYSSLPMIQSMELNTPCGRQSIHFHNDIDNEPMRLFKPRKENQWYMYDTLKSFLMGEWLNDFGKKLNESRNPLTRLASFHKRKKESTYTGVYSKLLKNPDSVDKIPIFLF